MKFVATENGILLEAESSLDVTGMQRIRGMVKNVTVAEFAIIFRTVVGINDGHKTCDTFTFVSDPKDGLPIIRSSIHTFELVGGKTKTLLSEEILPPTIQ